MFTPEMAKDMAAEIEKLWEKRKLNLFQSVGKALRRFSADPQFTKLTVKEAFLIAAEALETIGPEDLK